MNQIHAGHEKFPLDWTGQPDTLPALSLNAEHEYSYR